MDCAKNNNKTCRKFFFEKNVSFFFFYEDASRRLPITYHVKTKETWLRKKFHPSRFRIGFSKPFSLFTSKW